MSHPFEDWSKLNEGWDGGAVAVDEMLDNAKTVVGNSLGAVLIALAMLWAVKVALSFLVGSLYMVGAWVTDAVLPVAAALGFLAIPIAIFISLMQWSLYRPIQLQAFEGKEFVSGIGEVFKLAREVVFKVALACLLYAVAVGIGSIVCGVGSLVAAFFFCQAPYLAATTELKPWDCMRRSYELNKAYALPVVLAVAISLIATGVLTGCGSAVVGMVAGLIGSVVPAVAPLIANLAVDLLYFLSAAISLLVTGALFTTIQSVERGVPFKRA